MPHQPVLLAETLTALALQPAGCYVDATFGRGGHTQAILSRLGSMGRVIALDKDPVAYAAAQRLMALDPRLQVERGSYTMLERVAEQYGVSGNIAGVLLDLGVSSPQLDDALRGFSFLRDGPLDMRMDPTQGLSVAQWLADAAEQDIEQVLHEFGEERFARRIAHAIVTARAEAPLLTTGHLAAVVSAANPAWERDKHPATRSFQALRIFINHELDDLRAVLPQALNVLAPGGRLTVISFHSLEDRIVKRYFRAQAHGDDLPRDLPVMQTQCHPRLRLVGKAVHASAAEVAINPRARSAVLRVAEKL